MEKRATILSIGLSFLAMYLVWQYISGEDERLKSEYQVTENIVVAKRDILQYETIRPTDITLLTVPAKFLPLAALEIKKMCMTQLLQSPSTRVSSS